METRYNLGIVNKLVDVNTFYEGWGELCSLQNHDVRRITLMNFIVTVFKTLHHEKLGWGLLCENDVLGFKLIRYEEHVGYHDNMAVLSAMANGEEYYRNIDCYVGDLQVYIKPLRVTLYLNYVTYEFVEKMFIANDLYLRLDSFNGMNILKGYFEYGFDTRDYDVRFSEGNNIYNITKETHGEITEKLAKYC